MAWPAACSTGGAITCTLAPLGSYVGMAGSSTATLCPPGAFSAVPGAVSCTPAPVNYYDAGTGNATAATPCPAGTTSPTGSTSCSATTSLAYTGTDQVGIGSSFSPAAALSSPAASCESGQPVSSQPLGRPAERGRRHLHPGAATNSSPTGAVSGTAVSTSGWEDGVYTVTVSYSGATIGAIVSAPATTTAPLAVTSAGQFAFGDGWYSVPGVGQTSFGFVVVQAPGALTRASSAWSRRGSGSSRRT